ncbi:MAG: AIR synthase-related protein [Gammaproteobacteria bacterium]
MSTSTKYHVRRKQGLQPGDAIVLTKPVGTGTLLAAEMRAKAKGRWIDAAIQSMLLSNQREAECLQRYGANACADLTGFGTMGHLIEMTRASTVDAVLIMEAIPLLDGALETVKAGIQSSLQPQNLRLRRAIRDIEQISKHPAFPLLFDPQTAGGLLAGVPNEHVSACIDELHVTGYPEAAIIGEVEPLSSQQAPIRIS